MAELTAKNFEKEVTGAFRAMSTAGARIQKILLFAVQAMELHCNPCYLDRTLAVAKPYQRGQIIGWLKAGTNLTINAKDATARKPKDGAVEVKWAVLTDCRWDDFDKDGGKKEVKVKTVDQQVQAGIKYVGNLGKKIECTRTEVLALMIAEMDLDPSNLAWAIDKARAAKEAKGNVLDQHTV